MPITPTYPGVYVEEIPSGVRTITGVATSITAFVGKTLRGPVDEAVRVLSFADFAKRFGGLSASSEMSYAVQQFFLNGGSQAWIVRIAKDPHAAWVLNGLKNAATTPLEVFKVNAKYEGKVGNTISVVVDYHTRNPESTFNLTVSYRPEGNPADARIEQFPNLSMARVEKASTESIAANVIRRESELIKLVDVLDDDARKAAVTTKGAFESGEFLDTSAIPPAAATPFDFNKAVTSRSNQFQVQVNGLPAVRVTIKPGTDTADGVALCKAIQTQVTANSDHSARTGFTCAFTSHRIVMTSGSPGEDSRVEVLPGVFNDAFRNLKLSIGDGASQTDAVATLRPVEGTSVLQGGDEADFNETEEPALFVPDDDSEERRGIYALDPVDLFNLLCLPGMRDPEILAAAAVYCEKRRAFLIADSPGGNEASQVGPRLMEQTILGTSFPKTKNGAVFYPWIRVGNKLRPPSGTIAGLMARTDAQRGVWKAPAGTEANLVNVQGLEYALTDNENGILNPRGVNCIRLFPTYGIVAWGARTLVGDDAQASEWKYVPVRRTALFIEESLYRGTQWVVFEPNDEPLWAQIRLNVGAFMHNLFRQGAFQGKTPREAYFVKCDKETTTQNDINLGIVNIVIGFAPLKPAEFVIIKLQQMAGQIDV